MTEIEHRGGVFRDGGKPGDCLRIFASHGWNCFRLRLFVNPDGQSGVINTLEYTRVLAKRIKAANAALILDIHYSDTWADPQHQIKPASWSQLKFDDLTAKVEDYTRQVVGDLKANGVCPQIVQVGNEITGGTLWPDAQVRVPHSDVKVYDATVRVIEPPQPYDDDLQWQRLTQVLKAGIRGVRDATTPDDGVRILIHIDCGGDWPVTRWYFDHLTAAGVDYDIIGQSYYPNWHGTLLNVRDNLRQTIERYHKDVVIVETAYPWQDGEYWSGRRNMAWPITAQGQRQFLADLIQTVRDAPENHGIGVVYWHPESIRMRTGWTWNGGDMSLFDLDGNALPAISVLDPQ